MDEKNYKVFDILAEGVQVIDKNWKYVYVNKTVSKHGKSSQEMLLGKTMMEMYPGIEKTPVFVKITECMNSQIPSRLVNEFKFPDNSVGWFDLRILPVEGGVLILSLDITEQKVAELELQKKNGELQLKIDQIEILVKELHHRVRNNLQLILSLISLYSSKIENNGILEAIEECKNYVHSLAMVYNSMHSNYDYTKVDLDELISKLFEHHQTNNRKSIEIKLTIKKENTVVSIDAALTFGLLLNELIKEIISSNMNGVAVRPKTLTVTVKEKYDNFCIEMFISKEDKRGLEIKSQVYQIVKELLEQLNGEITIVNDHCMIAFDLNPFRVTSDAHLLD